MSAFGSEEERIAYTISVNAQEGIAQLNAFLKLAKDIGEWFVRLTSVITSFAQQTGQSFQQASSQILGMQSAFKGMGQAAQQAGQQTQQAKTAIVQASGAIGGGGGFTPTVAAATDATGKWIFSLGKLGNIFKALSGLSVIIIFKKIIDFLKEATQAGVDFLKVMYRMEVAAYALQRAGKDIDFSDLVKQVNALQKAFPMFSKQKAMESVSYIALLTREFGFAEKQIGDVTKASAVLAVIMGKDVNEAAREVALTLSSGYSESLQRAGLNINRVIIQQEALRMGYKEGYQYLSGEVKAQAALNVIMRQLDPLYDKALEYYSTLPGKIDTTRAAWENLKLALSSDIVPIREAWAEFWGWMFKNITDFITRKHMLEMESLGPRPGMKGYPEEMFKIKAQRYFPEGIPKEDYAKWIEKGFSQETLDRINKYTADMKKAAEATNEATLAAQRMADKLYLPLPVLEELKKKFAATDLVLYIDTEAGQKALTELDKTTAETRKNLVEKLGALGIDIDIGEGKKKLDEFDTAAAETRRQFMLQTIMKVDTAEAQQKVRDFEDYVKSIYPDGITLEMKAALLAQGLSADLIAQIERIVGTAKIKVPVKIDFWKAFKDEFGEEGLTDIVDRVKEFLDDIGKAMQEGLTDFQKDMAAIGIEYTEKIDRVSRDYIRDYNAALADAAKSRADAERDYRDGELKAEKSYQEALLKLREQFLFDLEDALRERDARQVLRLIRQYQMQKNQTARQNETGRQERAKNFQQELADIEAQKQERLALLRTELQERLDELEKERAKEEYERKTRWNEEQADLEAQQKEKMDKLVQWLVDEYNLDQAGAEAIAKMLSGYFGSGGVIAQLYDQMIAYVLARAAMIAQINAAIATMSGGGGSHGPPTRKRAKGGLDIVNKPTTLTFGEAGPEAALTVPLTGLQNFRMPANSFGGAPEGRIRLEVLLSPDLEARVVDQALSGVAATIDRVRREKR